MKTRFTVEAFKVKGRRRSVRIAPLVVTVMLHNRPHLPEFLKLVMKIKRVFGEARRTSDGPGQVGRAVCKSVKNPVSGLVFFNALKHCRQTSGASGFPARSKVVFKTTKRVAVQKQIALNNPLLLSQCGLQAFLLSLAVPCGPVVELGNFVKAEWARHGGASCWGPA
jgi:hypothetical protein